MDADRRGDSHGSQPQQKAMKGNRHLKIVLKLAMTILIALLVSLAAAQDSQEGTAESASGKEILARFIETNRYRQVQNLAMGLGWECTLTRLSREPESFWIETLAADTPGQYRTIGQRAN